MAHKPTPNSTVNGIGQLRGLLAALAVISVMTFLCGFLQDTPFNSVNYIFFFLLLAVGIRLIKATYASTVPGAAGKSLLFLTGASTIALTVFYTGYEWFRIGGQSDLEAVMEGFCYATTLFFLIGTIGSLIVVRSPKGITPTQS